MSSATCTAEPDLALGLTPIAVTADKKRRRSPSDALYSDFFAGSGSAPGSAASRGVRRSFTVESTASLTDLFNSPTIVASPLATASPPPRRAGPALHRIPSDPLSVTRSKTPAVRADVPFSQSVSPGGATGTRPAKAPRQQGLSPAIEVTSDQHAHVLASFLGRRVLPSAEPEESPAPLFPTLEIGQGIGARADGPFRGHATAPVRPKTARQSKPRAAPIRRSKTGPARVMMAAAAAAEPLALGLPPLPAPPAAQPGLQDACAGLVFELPPLPLDMFDPTYGLSFDAESPMFIPEVPLLTLESESDAAPAPAGPVAPSPGVLAEIQRALAASAAAPAKPLGLPSKSSKYKGVTQHCASRRWEAHLWDSTIERNRAKTGRQRGRQVYLGGFANELEASIAFDRAALAFFGLSKAATMINHPLSDYERELPTLLAMTKTEIVAELRSKSTTGGATAPTFGRAATGRAGTGFGLAFGSRAARSFSRPRSQPASDGPDDAYDDDTGSMDTDDFPEAPPLEPLSPQDLGLGLGGAVGSWPSLTLQDAEELQDALELCLQQAHVGVAVNKSAAASELLQMDSILLGAGYRPMDWMHLDLALLGDMQL